ncbi:hypothetical protein [Actinomadura gamaensis]|uniref:CinY protein n=1 Tax=Actinomadura gamaensis TaxID=1763541 RepID=A0ABV9U0W8_9ACTN
MKRSRSLAVLVGGAVACAAVGVSAPSAYSFGTLDGRLGQRAEHEHITRAALACPPGQPSDDYCFEPASLSELAGAHHKGGAIGAPDLGTEAVRQEAHCDNADYLAESGYPQSRAEASRNLLGCVDHAAQRMNNAVKEAGRLLSNGKIVGWHVSLLVRCGNNQVGGRAKCGVIEQFGRGLHAVQDFYSHSNWADDPKPGPFGVTNPPGLGHVELFPLFELFAPRPPTAEEIPEHLSTGCFDLAAAGSGERLGCSGGKRIRHRSLNKDTGMIDPSTGETSDPTTERGRVGANFARVVKLAIAETRRQWRDVVTALEQRYPGQGARMACAVTHDHPTKSCR